VWTDSGGGCQRAKQQSVKDHEGTHTHNDVANLQMNQRDMKVAVKTEILEHDSVLLNLTSIILSMTKNHNSLFVRNSRIEHHDRCLLTLVNLAVVIVYFAHHSVCLIVYV
jgi:hypothetical protein